MSSGERLIQAAQVEIGMHIVLDNDKVWRVAGVKRLPGEREFFLARDGDISRTTRKDTDSVRCLAD